MSAVRKAVIPAAGLGTRFLPATKAQPKEMLPVVDKPTIQYIIEEAVAAGIRNVLIVTGRDKRAIEDHFDRSPELEQILKARRKNALLHMVERLTRLAEIHYVRQKEPLGLGHAVLCAEMHIGDEPFAVLLGDDIIHGPAPCIQRMISLYEQYRCPVVAVQRVAPHEVSAYGVIAARRAGDRIHAVDDLVEKPAPEDAPSNLAIVGRYVLPPAVFHHLRRIRPGVGGELQLTDALRLLCRAGTMIAYEFEGVRHDVGDKLGYLRASIEMALERPDLRDALWSYLCGLVAENRGAASEGRAALPRPARG